jgi:hypothetical protein
MRVDRADWRSNSIRIESYWRRDALVRGGTISGRFVVAYSTILTATTSRPEALSCLGESARYAVIIDASPPAVAF